MDFEEWEYLPDPRFLDLPEGEKKNLVAKRDSFSRSVFNMDDRYFLCPSLKSHEMNDSLENPRLPKLVPISIQLKPSAMQTNQGANELENVAPGKGHVEDSAVPSTFTEKIQAPAVEVADQDTVSQVFFIAKENEFVDMKLDSPKSGSRGFPPQIEADKFQFEDKEYPVATTISPRTKTEKEIPVDKQIKSMNSNGNGKEKVDLEESGGRLNLWKRTLNGVGAICSFGFAATICILVFGNQQRISPAQPKESKIQFQFYAADKSIKRAVQQAAKLNEAISAVRGVPLNRAQITFGGYCDGI